MKNLKNLNDLINVSKKILKQIKPTDKICIVHHDDSDGCCSAALFSIIIHDLIGDYPILFPVTGLEKINSGFIKKINSMNPDYVFVFDLSVDPKEIYDLFLAMCQYCISGRTDEEFDAIREIVREALPES